MPEQALAQQQAYRDQIVDVLRNIFDPEIPVNIYDLGLIYNIDASPDGLVDIRMTLTSPSCPAAEILPPEVEQKTAAIAGIQKVNVHVVWEPTWTPEMMSEAARLELNMF